MDALDGNAIGGLLHDVFGTEMTTATGTCANCGAAAGGRALSTCARPAPSSAAGTAAAS